ncbi:phosphoenolpyruvate--protein phosphotransferase [Marinobacterium sp. AK62]|uniref:phosphoenolpyruvate--protein phosphotransferase n=1 Tax=Marinobacterium alkalitolerans TaxID=1542925 RepID=A0ABS3ZEB0_9GAMM|nr:phosphoenolpyruvate--protein phosphotransferase [Marinobacterium alkalitolerans]MBP0050037.1 phosphoenolpyruvate--protein phosphotransferase [Marinobacterium alkalitolerans]
MLSVLRKIVQEVSAAPDLESVLDLIVRRIQRTMKTQVCSIFLFDPVQQRYVLRATQGLNQDAVGKVSLSMTEGIVGQVGQRAEPINLEDAARHPAFHYLQATGEERYHAFLGVPIIHHRTVLGVLVVQQVEHRRFDESEEAFMVTLSAQLAGIIAHAEATGSVNMDTAEAVAGQADASESVPAVHDKRFNGVAAAPGVAIGTVVIATLTAELETVPDKPGRGVERERADFHAALEAVRDDLTTLGKSLAQRLKAEEQALFDVYLRMLDDSALRGEIERRIEQGQWAQGALRDVILAQVQQFSRMEDAYLRERATDVRDLGRRILGYLQESAGPVQMECPDNAILIADELSPAMLGMVPEEKLAGLVAVSGSGNSHAAIMARSIGIPTVMGVVDLPFTRLDGRKVIVDGYSGRIYVNPSERLLEAFERVIRDEQAVAAGLEELRDLPAETTDGYRMPLWVNTGLVADVTRSLERGAEGIGLYRTEIPFMIRDFFPSEQEQLQSYRSQLEAFAPRPVTMRTLDIGGDKALPYFPINEDNPFLGWRGIRVTLDHPEIFLVQVRAMLRASEGLDNLRIMLPMVTSIHEVEEALRQIDRAVAELQDEGYDIKRPPVGVMVEVPAAVYQVRRFARLVDFISVGSNDLTQYILAVDRNNPRVAGLYAAYHPAVLRALQYIARETRREGKPVSICGEMAADPGGALLLMAMGYEVLSMNANNLPRVKSAIRGVSLVRAQSLLSRVLRMGDAEEIHQYLRDALKGLGLGQLTRPRLPNQL